MSILAQASLFLVVCLLAGTSEVKADERAANRWAIDDPVFLPGPEGSFSEISVKDPTLVFFEGAWHLFFTARSREEYTTGYAAAKDLKDLQTAARLELPMIRGRGRYGCAPQVFYYRPQKEWYLIFQSRDSNYQPMFSTTSTIAMPESWCGPEKLIEKDSALKWIDFWVIADKAKVYLFYTEHGSVMVRSTDLEDFPSAWGEATKVFDHVHEAVHIYKVHGRDEFHMVYELNHGGVRSFGLATAGHLQGPWQKVTDRYATGQQLQFVGSGKPWTEMVSHGEALRTGYDQNMEYEPKACRWVIQGLLKSESKVPYPSLPWKLGVMTKSD